MRRFVLILSLCMIAAGICVGQTDSNVPASKEDIQRFFEAMHTRDMVHQMTNSMMQPMHQMAHEECQKEKDKMPPDCEQRLSSVTDKMFSNMPFDQMIDAMIPAYQKHFTKGDIDSFVTFYASPAGQKLLRELPAITAESMQQMMPLMRKYADSIQGELQAQAAEMAKGTPEQKTPSRK